MHAIHRPEHTWKPSSFVHLQKPLSVLSIGCSQVLWTEHFYHSYCKLLDIEDRSALCHRQVVINVICRNTICHHAQSGSDLLLNAMAKQPGTVPSLLEDWVMLLHFIANAKEQVLRHSKTTSKVILRKDR